MQEKYVMSMLIDAISKRADIKRCSFSDGYFIFDFGEDSVATIVFRGLRDWRWGVWVINDENDDTKHKVHLFGEHEYWIDKFKPTAVSISHEFSFTDDELLDNDVDVLGDGIDGFMRDVERIARHRLREEYSLYGEGEGFLRYHASVFFRRRVAEPFGRFKKGWLSHAFLRLAALAYTMRFRRRGNGFHVNVSVRPRGWWPSHVFQIVYGSMDDDTTYRTYCKIRRGDCHATKHGLWLIPDAVLMNTRVTDTMSDDDQRGFRYTDDAQTDESEGCRGDGGEAENC